MFFWVKSLACFSLLNYGVSGEIRQRHGSQFNNNSSVKTKSSSQFFTFVKNQANLSAFPYTMLAFSSAFRCSRSWNYWFLISYSANIKNRSVFGRELPRNRQQVLMVAFYCHFGDYGRAGCRAALRTTIHHISFRRLFIFEFFHQTKKTNQSPWVCINSFRANISRFFEFLCTIILVLWRHTVKLI